MGGVIASVKRHSTHSNSATNGEPTDDRRHAEVAAGDLAANAYKGLPAVRQHLKDIVPSLTIGVSSPDGR